MSKYVTFEISKLLKEKGFKIENCKEYFTDGTISESNIPKDVFYEAVKKNKIISCLAPEIYDVVDWLLDKHEIWIDVTIGKDCNHVWFDYNIYSAIKPRKDDELGEEFIEYEDDPNEKWLNYETTYDSMIDEKFEIMEKLNYPTPKEAYLAAIEYTLKHLI